MNLLPGVPLAVAPNFHLAADWDHRLAVAAGFERTSAGLHLPRPPWRLPSSEELALLTAAAGDPDERLCLFHLPGHLRSAFWQLLEQAGGGAPDELAGFDIFAREAARFLAFKGLPPPEGASFELLLGPPGQPSLFTGPARWPAVWAAVNLGEEDALLVLVNLSAVALRRELVERCPGTEAPAALPDLVERFLAACPDYPPVRLRLRPGEGCRLPAGKLPLDGWTLEQQEPAVLLLIR
jgi:hypothetical protein